MIPTRKNTHNPPTTEVRGGFPVHYLYTAGNFGEKFLYGLKDQKLLATTCGSCNRTYLPAVMFCEDCFDELSLDNFKEVGPSAELFSFTEVHVDHRGDPLDKPYYLGLIKVEGTSTTFFHKLVNITEPKIGMKLKPSWNSQRSGTIFDLNGFESN